ncbi:MAG TPA: methylated-DNA--[protein]-cysteine S-methyltransferase [Longimicrobiales bacterium]|nr:methylated-DNA--[protein]-cysteine S-methyltransferase [Longimicrobiales bacterium]
MKVTTMEPVVVHLSRVETPVGAMVVGATGDGVCMLEFADRSAPQQEARASRLATRFRWVFAQGVNDVSRAMAAELEAYFAGRLREFTTPVSPTGTPFQQRVWASLRRIRFGETRSYTAQAELAGVPAAVRAVARANGQNRIAIAIPCHRVVGADGSLTGYGGGVWRKEWLLRHEGVLPAPARARRRRPVIDDENLSLF